MTIAPDGRLVGIAAAATASAALLVVWPGLETALAVVVAGLAGIVLWDLVSLVRTKPVLVARVLPARAFLARDAEIVLSLTNDAERTALVDVIDELPSSIVVPEPRDAGTRIAPRTAVSLRHAVRPTQRGDVRLGPVVLLHASPLRLWRRRSLHDAGAVLRVYPDASRLWHAQPLQSSRTLVALGVRPARERGTGMEFESLRDYVVGDDVRRIDWAATARRGRPVTRLYRHERNRTVLIALDTSRLMGSRVDGRTKLDHAVDAALALAYAALAAGDQVGLITFDDRVRAQLAPAGRRHLGAFVDLLRTVEPRLVEADYRALARALAGGRRQRALVVVLTDFVDADAAAIVEPLALVARRHRVLFTAVRDRVYAALAPTGTDGPQALYRRLVLDELQRDRERALARLRQAGLETLDLAPEKITPAVLNRYLTIRKTVVA